MPTKEYLKEYIKEYRANHPDYYANELKKNNERNKAKYTNKPECCHKMLEFKKKYYQQKKLAKLESVKMPEN